MNKTNLFLIGIGLFIVALVIFFIRGTGGSGETSGNVYVSVTNSQPLQAPIESIDITFDRVELWDEEERGWFEVSEQEQTISMGELAEQNMWHALAIGDIPAHDYDRVRLGIERVTIGTTDGTTTDAFIINTLLSLDGSIRVATDTVTSINLDILTDSSIHETVDNQYAFIPVIKLESRSDANVSKDGDIFAVEGGTVDVNQTYGANANGGMRVNYRLPSNARIEEIGGSLLVTEPQLGRSPLDDPFIENTIEEESEDDTATTTEEAPSIDNSDEDGEIVEPDFEF